MIRLLNKIDFVSSASTRTEKKDQDMDKNNHYRASDKMSSLICDNYVLLQVMSRFGLSLGFGDHTVSEVCKKYQVDCATFLAVVNFLIDDNEFRVDRKAPISIAALMSYLKKAHNYFLQYQLPSIREKLVVYLQYSDNQEIPFLILNFFDAYADELHKHMEYENKHVFTYVNQLLEGRIVDNFNFANFASSHNQVDTKLTELKDIIIKYLPTKGDNYHTNNMLFEIFACIQDLDSHSRVEDCIFVPAVLSLEKERKAS